MTSYYFGTIKYVNNESPDYNSHSLNSKFFNTKEELVNDLVSNYLVKMILDGWSEVPNRKAEKEMDAGGVTDYSWDNYIKMKKIVTADDLGKFTVNFSDDPGQHELQFFIYEISNGSEQDTDGKRQRVN